MGNQKYHKQKSKSLQMKNFAAAIIFAIGACAAADTDVITGAEIHSRDTFKFGRFVASMRGPVTEGTVAELYTI